MNILPKNKKKKPQMYNIRISAQIKSKTVHFDLRNSTLSFASLGAHLVRLAIHQSGALSSSRKSRACVRARQTLFFPGLFNKTPRSRARACCALYREVYSRPMGRVITLRAPRAHAIVFDDAAESSRPSVHENFIDFLFGPDVRGRMELLTFVVW